MFCIYFCVHFSLFSCHTFPWKDTKWRTNRPKRLCLLIWWSLLCLRVRMLLNVYMKNLNRSIICVCVCVCWCCNPAVTSLIRRFIPASCVLLAFYMLIFILLFYFDFFLLFLNTDISNKRFSNYLFHCFVFTISQCNNTALSVDLRKIIFYMYFLTYISPNNCF